MLCDCLVIKKKGAPMGKLYLKKLKRGIIYALIMYVILVLCDTLLVTLSNFFREHPIVQLLVIVGIPAMILFYAATYYRANDNDKFKAYNRSVPYDKLNLGKDLIYTLRSPELWGDVLVAVTLIGLYLIPTVIIPTIRAGGAKAIPVALLSSTLTLLVAVALYTVADIISWIITHKHYLTDRDLVVMDSEMNFDTNSSDKTNK